MAPRPTGQTSIFGDVFSVSKSLGNRETKETFNFDPNASETSEK